MFDLDFKKEVNEKLDLILKRLDHNILEKAKKYDELLMLLNNIIITSTATMETNRENGEDFVKVEYKIEPAIIKLNDDGEIDCSKQFYSINMLNLLPMENTDKIQELINNLKKSK